MSSQALTYISMATIVVATGVAGLSTWLAARARTSRTDGWSVWAWPIYGIILAVLAAFSVHLGLFAVGMLAPLLSHNVHQAWAASVLGAEDYTQARDAIRRGGRLGYFLATFGTVIIRSTPGAVLVWGLPTGSPFAWLGMGILASAAGTLASAYRIQQLALTSPSASEGHSRGGG